MPGQKTVLRANGVGVTLSISDYLTWELLDDAIEDVLEYATPASAKKALAGVLLAKGIVETTKKARLVIRSLTGGDRPLISQGGVTKEETGDLGLLFLAASGVLFKLADLAESEVSPDGTVVVIVKKSGRPDP